jgi:geranylgeranyl diphosphate synthase, type II
LNRLLGDYLSEVHGLVIDELRTLVSGRKYRPMLYDLMLDYPLRGGKGLRPALCIAICRALGGRLEDVVRTAAVIELYHNAFLIHDDVEDGSLLRRGKPTLHREYGVPTAVNVGDAMLAMAMKPLLDNTRLLGLGKALTILDTVARMALESAEGQAMELDWSRRNVWRLSDVDYWHLVYKKTCWYTFIAPMLIGAIAADLPRARMRRLRKFAILVGVSFQIQDDVLNLEAEEAAYGKEIAGDLVEGKRTLILLHAMRSSAPAERDEAERILSKQPADKTETELVFLGDLLRRTGSIDYARTVALDIAGKALRVLDTFTEWTSPSVHVTFLRELVGYVVERDR